MVEFNAELIEEAKKGLAEIAGDTEKVTQYLFKLVDNQKIVYSQLSSFVKKLGEGNNKIEITASTARAAIKKIGETISHTLSEPSEFFKKIGVSLEDVKKGIGNTFGGTEKLTEKLMLVAGASSGMLDLSKGVKQIGESATDSAMQMSEIGEKLSRISSITGNKLPKGLSTIAKFGKNFISAAQGATNLENALMKNAAAAGDLSSVLGKTGNTMENVDTSVLNFHENIKLIGNATGKSSSQVAAYYTQLQAIPGVLKQNVLSTGEVAGSMKMLDATIMVARGTMRETKDVIDDLTSMYKTLGITGQDALEVISRMSEANNKMKLPLDTVKGLVNSTAKDFMYFGKAAGSMNNNLNGAIDILSKMGPALKNYGLGPDAIQALVQRFTSGIAQLNMAQKAFLSAQTGGAGGLKGAFEIDLMLREGDLEGVFDRVRESLMQQFGGRIVTLEEAARSEDAAAQMAKQIQMLTSGPLKMAEGEAQAKAIIEAMASGEGVSTIAEGQESLNKTLKMGDDVRKKQQTALVAINNEIEYWGALAAENAKRIIANTAGIGSQFTAIKDFVDKMQGRGREAAAFYTTGARIEKGATTTPEKEIEATMSPFNQLVKETQAGATLFKTNEERKKEELTSQPATKPEAIKQITYLPTTPPTRSSEDVRAALSVLKTEPGAAGAMGPASKVYNVDVVCASCTNKQFSGKFNALEANVEVLNAKVEDIKPSATGPRAGLDSA